MSNRILVFYGSYRSDRMGIRLAAIRGRAAAPPGRRRRADRRQGDQPSDPRPDVQGISEGRSARGRSNSWRGKIRGADGFVFVTGEYNWGVQPGLKNLTDHFLEEWFWRPAAIVELFGRTSVRRAGRDRLARHALRDGNGGGLQHDRCWSDRTDPVGRRRARPARAARRLNRRSRALPTISCGGSKRQGAATAQAAAVLTMKRRVNDRAVRFANPARGKPSPYSRRKCNFTFYIKVPIFTAY